MTQTLANRMTTNPNQPFVACSALSVRPECLNRQSMTEISGGIHPVVVQVLGGVTGVALTNPQQIVDAVDWYGDRISEGIDWVAEGIDWVADQF